MSEQAHRRKRIPIKKGKMEAIEDPDAFIKNRCSDRAKKIETIKPTFDMSIWFDQHYQIRTQFGDDDGLRLGIEAVKVTSLVQRAMTHLLTYSTVLKTFSFVNHGTSAGGRNERVVLQEKTDDGLLNVVVEVHLVEPGVYEITVKTAMCHSDFSIADGQYALEIVENGSTLRKKERGVLKEVSFLEY